jgi:hypothetical protein
MKGIIKKIKKRRNKFLAIFDKTSKCSLSQVGRLRGDNIFLFA